MGRAICHEFARHGAVVVVADLAERPARNVAQEIEAEGGKASVAVADVTSRAQLEGVVSSTLEKFSRIDVLVSNAGMRLIKPFLKHTEDDWNRTLSINLTGHFLCAQSVVPAMLRQGKGKIIVTASIAGLIGRPDRVAYCAAKAGALGLVRAMAVDLRHSGICVNALLPGSIATPFNQQAVDDPSVDWGKETLVGRWGLPDEVAKAALFLASDDSDYVNGAELRVDGGWLAGKARDGELRRQMK
jgi:NAD(P)-dependent dehydrogenase (short-subunit alcohol dehydrogenase family)